MNFDLIKKEYPSLYIYKTLGDEICVKLVDVKRTIKKHNNIYIPFIFDFRTSKFQESFNKKIYTLKIIT